MKLNLERNPMNRAFTLIELLVVISIIALLSSVILAALSGARTGAQVASGLEFSTYNYHAFGLDAYGYWNFNKSSGATLDGTDSSGNGLNFNTSSNYTGGNGIVNVTPSSFTPSGSGKSAYFNGTGGLEYESIGRVSTMLGGIYSNPGQGSGNYSMSAWINVTAFSGSQQYVIAVRDVGTYILGGIVINAGTSPTVTCTNGTNGSSGPTSVTVLKVNTWYHIACGFDYYNNATAILYVDGKIEAKTTGNTMTGKFDGIDIGQNTSEASNFSGYIDEVAFYNTNLTADEVYHLYAEGLPPAEFAMNARD